MGKIKNFGYNDYFLSQLRGGKNWVDQIANVKNQDRQYAKPIGPLHKW